MPITRDNRRCLLYLGLNPSGDLGPFTFYTSRRRRPVFFPKAPPKKPATWLQRHNRNRFVAIGEAWQRLPPSQRAAWLLAARAARLSITGYNLWVWFAYTHDRDALATIERLAGVTLA